MWKPLAAATLTTLALSAPALADTHIAYVNDAGQPATQVDVKDGKVRAVIEGNVVLYDAAKRQLTMLDDGERSYTVLSADTMKQVGAMLAAAGRDPAGGKGMKIQLKPLGSSQKVAGFACKDMQVVVDGENRGRSCIAALDSLGIPAADRDTLEAMRAGLKDMTSIVPGGPSMTDFMPEGLALEFEGRARKDRETLKAISHGAVKAGLFAVPAGYTEKPFPLGGME